MKCTDGGEQPQAHTPTLVTRATVVSCVAAGFNQDTIAKYLQISLPTLFKHYRSELDNTLVDKTIRLSDSLYKDAIDGCKESRKFWLQCRAKWAISKPPEEKEKDEKMISVLEKLADKL